MRIEVHVYTHPSTQSSEFGELKAMLGQLASQLHDLGIKIMATLDDVIQDMTDETTAIGGIATLIAGLKQQLADALAGTTLPPAVQAKVDAVFAAAEANKAALATALAAGVTPPAP